MNSLPTLVLLVTLSAPNSAQETAWKDVRTLAFEGQAWTDTQAPFDRLPAKSEGVVRDPVWKLSQESAGLGARFVTDATSIRCRWTLRSEELAMPHMPATGVSGVDLFARDDEGEWRWLACGKPSGLTTEATLITGLKVGEREYWLYLPLYNGVTSCEIGVAEGAKLEPGPARAAERSKPLVFYGTSITQGACASRPGACHTALLGRRLDRPVINLGFSGQGKMDLELADLLAEIDAAVYVIDCLPNMNAKLVTERAEPFVRKLRAARPDTPILLVEDRSFANSFLVPSRQKHHAASRQALRAAYETLVQPGVQDHVQGLHYLEGADLIGNEDTVDASHPTDLGFARQADRFEPALGGFL